MQTVQTSNNSPLNEVRNLPLTLDDIGALRLPPLSIPPTSQLPLFTEQETVSISAAAQKLPSEGGELNEVFDEMG